MQTLMSQWPDTSESLIIRIRDPHDAVAWSQFIAIYQPVVYRLARRRGLQHADAEDLCQRVFASVARAIEKWEPRSEGPRFRNWLSRVSRNATLNAITRIKPDQATGTSSVQELLLHVPDRDAASTEILNESRREAFRWATEEVRSDFNELTWIMFRETTICGRTVTEVAASLNRSSGAVYIARCRVMQRIKEKVKEVSDLWSSES